MTFDAAETHPEQGPNINRRRVLQGAAWAAPLVVVASAVPAAAASVTNPLTGTTALHILKVANDDTVRINVVLPTGVTLLNAVLTVSWTGTTRASELKQPSWGSATTSPANSTSKTSVVTASSPLSAGPLEIVFDRAVSGPIALVLSGTTSTGESVSLSFSGTLSQSNPAIP